MALEDITSRQAVLDAITECDQLGRKAFLKKYGFGRAKNYFLIVNEKEYDSKAIAGVAHGKQFPQLGFLQSAEFSGGKATVLPVLEKAGFEIRFLTNR